jgi:hypothetical protein
MAPTRAEARSSGFGSSSEEHAVKEIVRDRTPAAAIAARLRYLWNIRLPFGEKGIAVVHI